MQATSKEEAAGQARDTRREHRLRAGGADGQRPWTRPAQAQGLSNPAGKNVTTETALTLLPFSTAATNTPTIPRPSVEYPILPPTRLCKLLKIMLLSTSSSSITQRHLFNSIRRSSINPSISTRAFHASTANMVIKYVAHSSQPGL